MENKNMLKDFIKLIAGITDKPGMYMVNNVEDLSLVIWGYKCGCNVSDRELVENLMGDFMGYVNRKFETKENIEWVRLIRFHGFSDDNTLNLFKQLFTEFIDSNVS